MKKALIIGLLGLIAIGAHADEDRIAKNKHFSLGLVSQATAIAYEEDDYYCGGYSCYSSDSTIETDSFSGFGVLANIAINNAIAFRGQYANQKHEDDSSLKMKSLGLGALFGTGLARKGFKAYGTIGFYRDTVKNEKFSGLYGGGGLGYNFGPVSIEGYMHLREASDYKEIYGADSSPFGVQGGLAAMLHF